MPPSSGPSFISASMQGEVTPREAGRSSGSGPHSSGHSRGSGPTKTHKGYNRDGRPFEVEDKKETGEDGLATLGKELLRAQMNGKK